MAEPTEITAGDTLSFSKSLADYPPADSWVLSYVLVNESSRIEFAATDGGDGTHQVSVDAATTVDWKAGRYRWQAYATKALERQTVDSGELTIKANFAAAAEAGLDGRGQWQKILDELQAAYAAMAANDITTATISHNNRSKTYRTIDEMKTAINHAKHQVEIEKRHERLAKGLPLGNKVNFRF